MTTSDGPTSGDVSLLAITWAADGNWTSSNTELVDLDLPAARGADVLVDNTRIRPFAMLAATTSMIFSGGFFLASMLAATGYVSKVSTVIVAIFLLSSTVHFFAGLGFFLNGYSPQWSSFWIIIPPVLHDQHCLRRDT